MVDLVKKEIRLQGKVFPIVGFGVYWAVEPHGIFASLEELAKELPVFENMRPVSVALTDTPGVYEVL